MAPKPCFESFYEKVSHKLIGNNVSNGQDYLSCFESSYQMDSETLIGINVDKDHDYLCDLFFNFALASFKFENFKLDNMSRWKLSIKPSFNVFGQECKPRIVT